MIRQVYYCPRKICVVWDGDGAPVLVGSSVDEVEKMLWHDEGERPQVVHAVPVEQESEEDKRRESCKAAAVIAAAMNPWPESEETK